MKRRILFLMPLLFLCVAESRAETACPWLTQGTAAAMLEGDVSANVQSASPDTGSCRFSLRNGASEYVLKITVAGKPGVTCPPGSPKVPGVGSEAFSCQTRKSSEESSDMISGRVRAIFFLVRLTGKGMPDSPMTPEKRSDIVERAAETVAGNLF